jgi:16S rRNA processing protein RimM
MQFALGYVSRVIGLRGEISIKCFDPKSEVLIDITRIALSRPKSPENESRTYQVLASRFAAHGEFGLMLKGISNREQAEVLTGSTVSVLRADLEPPEKGSYFAGDLVGMRAVDEAGTSLGVVEQLLNTGPVPNLLLRHSGDETLVPFAEEFVLSIDVAAETLVLRLPVYENDV